MKQNGTVKEFVQKNAMQLAMSAFGLLVAVINLFLAGKLAPLAQSLSILETRTSAIEKIIGEGSDIDTDIAVIKQRLIDIDRSLLSLERGQERLETKFDQVK